jgi:glycerol-3-phosphate dehydrogenase
LTELAGTFGRIGAQARLAVRQEFCRHLDDFLLRRTDSAFTPGLGAAVAPDALAALGEELAWNRAERDSEWQRYQAAVERAHAVGAEVPPATTRNTI